MRGAHAAQVRPSLGFLDAAYFPRAMDPARNAGDAWLRSEYIKLWTRFHVIRKTFLPRWVPILPDYRMFVRNCYCSAPPFRASCLRRRTLAFTGAVESRKVR